MSCFINKKIEKLKKKKKKKKKKSYYMYSKVAEACDIADRK